jgi:hypothetical protein
MGGHQLQFLKLPGGATPGFPSAQSRPSDTLQLMRLERFPSCFNKLRASRKLHYSSLSQGTGAYNLLNFI